MLNTRFRDVAVKAILPSVMSLAVVALTGCGIGPITTAGKYLAPEGSGKVAAVRIDGHVHGGAFPIQNATVILMETQSNGTWTPSSGNYVGTAKSLYATTSDSLGRFTFPDTGWTCDAGQYVYIEVTGGHTASTNNPNVIQLGVVGDCASDLGNKTSIDGLNVWLSEPSTVAAAYALRPFLSTHTGNLTGVTSDSGVSQSTNLTLVDITAPMNNNAVSANPSLNPASTATGAVQAPLAFNANGIYNDGTTFSTGGFDQDGNSYSAQLVPTSLTYAGVPYTLGPANQLDVVRGGGGAVALPSGTFDTLNILAAGTNGSQPNQTFIVTYADGTTTSFTQSISDWYSQVTQNYAGESQALSTSYRDKGDGTRDTLTSFLIYQYSFAIDRSKLIKSLTLPNNSNVLVLAVTATSNLPTCSGVRAGKALSCTASGLAHAFQNAYNLVDQVTFSASQFPTGVARTTLPTNSTATAPREMINTLSNILQECVDSGGGAASDGTPCGNLFLYTTPANGTAPKNTLQAAINMATYPSSNVSQLMALKPRTIFFSPEISQPSSPQNFAFTLSIFYKGTDLGDTFSAAQDLALDVQDNLYVTYQKQSAGLIDEISPAGKGIFSSSLSAVANPSSIATDNNGFVWVTDDTATSGGVTGLYTSVNAAGSNTQGSSYKTVAVRNGSAAGLAFDASSNMFVTRDSATGRTTVLYTASSAYATTHSSTQNFPMQHAAVDARGNFYGVGANNTGSKWLIYPFGTCGNTAVASISTLSAASGVSMAVNNNVGNANPSYNALVPASGQVATFNAHGTCNTLTNETPASSRSNLQSTTPTGAAMDGNLSVFWSDSSTGYLYSLPAAGGLNDISSATVTSFAPCLYTGSACASTSAASFTGMAIDSSGAMWVLSQGTTYGLVQTLGMAAPTWPLLASENSGVAVQ